MQTCGALARREQAGHIRHLAVSIDSNPAHHVMGGWSNFHRLFSDIDIGELLELVIHAGQLSLDVLSTVREAVLDPGDIEKNAAVRASPPFANFTHYRARNVIASEQFRWPTRISITLCI